MIKPSEKNSNKNIFLIHKVFFDNIPNGENYQLIYGYFLNDGYFSSKMISYIIGINTSINKIAIIPINSNCEITGSIIYSDFKNIESLKFIGKELLFLKLNKPQIELKINIQTFTKITQTSSNVLPIIQENNFKYFTNFIKQNNLHRNQ